MRACCVLLSSCSMRCASYAVYLLPPVVSTSTCMSSLLQHTHSQPWPACTTPSPCPTSGPGRTVLLHTRTSKTHRVHACKGNPPLHLLMCAASLCRAGAWPKPPAVSGSNAARTSSPYRSGSGNSHGPDGAIDCSGLNRSCGRAVMSNVSPLMDPAASRMCVRAGSAHSLHTGHAPKGMQSVHRTTNRV